MSAPTAFVRERPGGVEMDLVVQPRASRSAVVGLHDGRLKVSLAAPPVDGEANVALVALLSSLLSVPKRAVVLVRGDAGRRKTVSVEGATREAVHRLLMEAAS